MKFENHMMVTTESGYERELVRWTKGGYDRVYINGDYAIIDVVIDDDGDITVL